MTDVDFAKIRHGANDLVAVGGDLEPETLLAAYRHGVFPWPIEGLPLPWFCPLERAVLFFDELHVARKLAKLRRNSAFELTRDRDFTAVIQGCADAPRDDPGTWITPEMVQAYCELHRLGHAHSVEVWQGERLVGGIYGVQVDGVFSAESMFHLEDNASKLALLELVDWLRDQGMHWLDVQVMNPHLESLGARPLPRDEYLTLLERSRRSG